MMEIGSTEKRTLYNLFLDRLLRKLATVEESSSRGSESEAQNYHILLKLISKLEIFKIRKKGFLKKSGVGRRGGKNGVP